MSRMTQMVAFECIPPVPVAVTMFQVKPNIIYGCTWVRFSVCKVLPNYHHQLSLDTLYTSFMPHNNEWKWHFNLTDETLLHERMLILQDKELNRYRNWYWHKCHGKKGRARSMMSFFPLFQNGNIGDNLTMFLRALILKRIFVMRHYNRSE